MNLSPTTRRWIYGCLLAAFPVACFYVPALVPAAPLWLALALALLNVPAADAIPAADVVASVNSDGHLAAGLASTLPTGALVHLEQPVRNLVDPTA